MDVLRIVAGRTFATLWVAVLAFLALAQPAHALFGSPTVAVIAQAVAAALLGSAFALRGTIRRQCERLGSFLARSRGLRAAVRTMAVEALAAPIANAADAGAAAEVDSAAATPARTAPPRWSTPGEPSSAVPAGTSLQTAASAPRRPTPPFPPTTA